MPLGHKVCDRAMARGRLGLECTCNYVPFMPPGHKVCDGAGARGRLVHSIL